MNKKLWLTLLSSAVLGLVSCNNTNPNNNNEQKKPKYDYDYVPVFVMTGQSNMEGSSNWRYNGKNLLKEEMTSLGRDYSIIDPNEDNNNIDDKKDRDDGVENVLTSYYGFYYPNGWGGAHTSSMDTSSELARLQPNFKPTTIGMGVADGGNDDFFGPEVGMAYKFSSEYDGVEPIHLIKCAFSGSGFEKNDGPNWKTREDSTLTDAQNASKSLYFLLKKYTNNCLESIAAQGKTPIIKGLLWHQGESDTGNPNYQTQMESLISDFRNDYADYAEDGNGGNIAFIDCTIYDGPKQQYGDTNSGINVKKNAIAAKGQLDPNDENFEKNYIVDGTFTENGLKLEIGDADKGGYNTYHYNTKDAYILGEAYADIIINNGLLK